MTGVRSFKELVQKRIVNDPAFGDALLREFITPRIRRMKRAFVAIAGRFSYDN
jgi:hypothetical protein